MTTAGPDKPPTRKFPPPCWTQDEALALIESYRERWYALGRGYLRTADWDSVADDVGRRFPDTSPAKTSAQCRHKMEKLRQRYRAEKQRSQSYLGRFFSSWLYFESMEAMENGSSSNQETPSDKNCVLLGFNLKNSKKSGGDFSSPNFEQNVHPVKGVNYGNSVPVGIRLKNTSKIDGNSSPNFGYRGSNGYSTYLDGGSDEEPENVVQYGAGTQELRGKKFGSEIRIKTPIDPSMLPLFRARKFGKIDVKLDPEYDCDDGSYDAVDADGDHWLKTPNDWNLQGKFSGNTNRKSNHNFDPYLERPDFQSKSGSSGGVKRGRNPVEDMVTSIKLLGEGFVKMEKMKMDMAKEIEKMRMEMEMKRNEMIVESQQKIVDAFAKGLFEYKNKVKTTVSPDL